MTRVLLGVLGIALTSIQAVAQEDATTRTLPELLHLFRDGQGRGAIVPRNMRDLVRSAMTGQFPSVRQFGAVGDNATDDTAAIQACIDSLPATGGACFLPSGSYVTSAPIILRSGVSLIGESSAFADLTTRIFGDGGSGGFAVLSDGGVHTERVSIEKIALRGKNASGSRGIYAPNTPNTWRVRDVSFDWFGDECMKIGAHGTEGTDGLFEANFGQNCVLVRTGRSEYIGAMDMAVSDARILNNEFTASVYNPLASIFPGEGLIGDGYIAAIVIRASNSLFYGNICQISQVGCVIGGYGHNIVLGNRADLNQGTGFIITSQSNSVANNHSYRNSRTADGAYPGFLTTSSFNNFTDNRVSQCGVQGGVESCAIPDDGSSNHPRQGYGFVDTSNDHSDAYASNYYSGNRVSGTANDPYSFSGITKRVGSLTASTGGLDMYANGPIVLWAGSNGLTITTAGAADAAAGFKTGGVAGMSGTIVVKGSGGSNCNVVVSGGIITSTNCP